MPRHNREGKGVDQHGQLWHVSYQPDWFRRVKISRRLPGRDRRSTLTLCENPEDSPEKEPGRTVRTRIRAADGSVDFTVAVEDRGEDVDAVSVTTHPDGAGGERVEFVIYGGLEEADD